MKKYLTTVVLFVFLVLSGSITAFAAPELVNVDGVWLTFDSEYYAANNPDVAAALGTDADALLQHYISAGQYEGRLCCAPMAQAGTAKILSQQLYHTNDAVITPATRLVKIIRYKPDGTVRSTSDIIYDSRGNLISDQNCTYKYDQHGNLVEQGWSSGIKVCYDGKGNFVEYLGAVFDNIYDSKGNLTEHIQHEGKDGKTIYRVKYTYDNEGKLVGKVGAYDGKKPDLTEVRRYNDKGQIIYKGQGVGLEALPFPGFNQEVQADLYYEYFYDALGRLTQENNVSYEYDSRGNMVRRTAGSGADYWEYIYE